MYNTRSFSLRTLSVVLSFCLLVVSLPLSAFANAGGNVAELEEDPVFSNAEIIEIEEDRTVSEKTFRLEDGTFYIAHYDTEIHEEDENGNLIDIDNRLYEKADRISTENGRYSFPNKTSDSSPLFSLSGKDDGFSFVLNSASIGATGEITNQETEFGKDASRLDELITLDNIKSSVLYKDILPNTDVQYVIYGKNVKENIILKERQIQNEYIYSFTLSFENLVPVLAENGQIDLVDPATGETVYFLPKPAMWDAAGEFSDAVYYELTETENGLFTLIITANPEWINDENRVFPVTVDPSVYSSTSNVLDTYVDSANPASSYSDSSTLYVSSTQRCYWKLTTLPALPKSAYITGAEIKLNAFPNMLSHTNLDVAAYEVLTDWDSTLTWNKTVASTDPAGQIADTFVDYNNLYTNYVNGGFYFAGNGEYTWNITPIVKKWYEGTNYGVAFAVPSGGASAGTAQFRSNDYSTASVRPSLCITYADMKGLEDYWSFNSQDAGFAGKAYINNATGNLVVNIPTLTTTDSLMPVTPSLVYNLCMYFGDYKYPTVQTANTTAFTPRSFKLNINETLILKSYTDASGNEGNYIIWADGDGTEHYFFPVSSGSATYEDEDGLHLTLTVNNPNSPKDGTVSMTDSNDTVKTFTNKSSLSGMSGVSGAWFLTDITDKSGNRVNFTLDSSYYYPTKISLYPKNGAEIVQLRIEYNSAKKPYVIWNPTSGEGVLLRYSSSYGNSLSTSAGNYLRRVIRAHVNTITGSSDLSKWSAFYNTNDVVSTSDVTVDAYASYNYNYLGIVTKITNNLTGYRLTYNVNNGKKVSFCREVAFESSTNGQRISYSYGTSNTVVRSSGKDDIYNNSDDLLTTYTYDSYGRTVSCYTTDLNKTQIYGASGGQYVSTGDFDFDSGHYKPGSKNNLKSSVQTTQQSSNHLLNGGFELNGGSLAYWSTTGSVSLNTLMAQNSLNAAQLQITSGVSSSSAYQYVDLDKGDYALSLDINTDDTPSGITVYLKAESQSNSAHSVTKRLPVNEYYATGSYSFASLNFSADPSTSGGKERFKITVIISGTVSSSEEIWIDNVMLSRTTGAAEFDMSSAGHFETSYGYSPSNFWSIMDHESTPISAVDSGIAAFGDVLYIDAEFSEYEFVQQTVYQATDSLKYAYVNDPSHPNPNPDPVVFTVSGWAKGTGQAYTAGSNFCIRAEITYYSLSGTSSTERFYAEFDRGTTEWQFTSNAFAYDPEKGMIDKITLLLMYNGHQGECFFDNVSFVRSDSNSSVYEYASTKGYLSKATNGNKVVTYEYDSSDGNKVTKTVNTASRSITEYTYDSAKRISSEKVSKYNGIFNPVNGTFSNNTTVTQLSETDYTYDTYGLVTQILCKDLANSGIKTRALTEYIVTSGSHIFGAVSKETDALGNETKYFYGTGSDTGRLKAVIYPNTTGTCYKYDPMGHITEVLPAEVSGNSYSESNDSSDVAYTYDSATKRLSSITTTAGTNLTTTYSFTYDVFGNTTETKVGTRTLANYTYNSENGKLNTLVYGNGLNVQYVYDAIDRISEIKYRSGSSGSFTTAYTYSYDSAGNLYSVTDVANHEITVYNYDAAGRLLGSNVYDSSTNLNKSGTTIDYDDQSRVKKVINSFDYNYSSGTTYDKTYRRFIYSSTTGNVEQMCTNGDYISGTIDPLYDNLGRTSTRIIDYDINNADAFYNNVTYTYEANGGYTSGRVSTYSSIAGKSPSNTSSTTTRNYTYDSNGNITAISGSETASYEYDALGQLVRENNYALGKTYKYNYDRAGNITSKIVYAYTTGNLSGLTPQQTITYSYTDSSWKDLLTNYNGATISYDSIGNPTSMGSMYLSWKGRQLTGGIIGPGNISFTYNADGIRTSKQYYNGIYSDLRTTRHEYTLNSTQIVKETVLEKSGNASTFTESYTLVYTYDENGSPIGFRYREPSYAQGAFDGYFFEKNLQGDVIGIWNQSGTKVVSYVYDAWGNVTVSGTGASTIGAINPIRYRSYYYDTETGFYYLQSRYYNPTWGRFLNADGQLNGGLLGYNLFAYCNNNPINNVDPDGDIAITTLILIIACVAGIASAGYTAYSESKMGYDTSDVILDSVTMGLSAFATVYSCGLLAYNFYIECSTYYGYTPVTEIGRGTEISIEEQIQSCADNANNSLDGCGHVIGSKKHSIFSNNIEALGNPDIRSEVSFMGGQEVRQGFSGSVRFDVVQYKDDVPVMAWDFKTGQATLSQSRIDKMHSISGLDIPIIELKGR